jgi:hypothetical protein
VPLTAFLASFMAKACNLSFSLSLVVTFASPSLALQVKTPS